MATNKFSFEIWDKICQPLAMFDRCMLNRGEFALEINWGLRKWPLTGGSCLIEVTASAGATLFLC